MKALLFFTGVFLSSMLNAQEVLNPYKSYSYLSEFNYNNSLSGYQKNFRLGQLIPHIIMVSMRSVYINYRGTSCLLIRHWQPVNRCCFLPAILTKLFLTLFKLIVLIKQVIVQTLLTHAQHRLGVCPCQ